MARKKVLKPGSVDGRPREHDREQIALDLIEWAKKEDSINLNKFCCTREPPIPATKLLLWSKECDNFRISYETAKAFLGCRREEWLSKELLHVKAYDLNVNAYDLIAKEEKMSMLQYEASLRKEADSKPTEINIKVSNDGLGRGLGISTKRVSTTNNRSTK
jgi:hypothetical protein